MEQYDHKLVKSIADQQDSMVSLLHQFCEINTCSNNLPGLALMSDTLQQVFAPIADKIEIHEFAPIPFIDMQGNTVNQQYGDALFIQKRPERKRRILLAGHMDTVYSADSDFQKLTYLNPQQINGPGVADMKGGLIVILQALTALEQSSSNDLIGWDVIINADEEVGSEASSALFSAKASQYQAALLYEPAMNIHGDLARNRKGNGKFTVIAYGKAAHAGRNFDEGRNAIAYLSEVISSIHALNGKRKDVTLNVGLIAGGEGLNVVPAKAVAKIDVRIDKDEDAQWVLLQFENLKTQFQRPDFNLTIEGKFGRPVKKVCGGSERLFARLQAVGSELGLHIDWQDSGGCCDGNNLSQFNLPILDTLGVRGGNIHSDKEFIQLSSLSERASLSALLLLDLARGGLEDLKK